MTSADSAATTATSSPALSGTLGVTAILLMVVATASPLGVVAGGVPIGALLGNGAGLPPLYIAAAIVLLLFAVGYCAMSARITHPGAFFQYIGVGLGLQAGTGAAWLALLTYYAMQVAIYAYGGAVLSATVGSVGGPALPLYVYSLVWVSAIGVLGYRSIDVSARVLLELVLAEVAIVLVGVAAIVLQGGAEGLSPISFQPTTFLAGAPGIGLMFVVGAFIGFEATAIFRDEAKDPARTIPRATYLAVAGMGAFYAIASWGLIMGWGPSQLDPILQVYSRLSGVDTVGIVVLMSATAVAVIACFSRDSLGMSIWQARIAPALGLLGLAGIGAVIVANFPLLVGDVDDAGQPAVGPLTIGLLCTIVVAITIGVAQSVRLHRSPGREARLLP